MMVLFHWYSNNVKQCKILFPFMKKVYKNRNMHCPILCSIISPSMYVICYMHTYSVLYMCIALAQTHLASFQTCICPQLCYSNKKKNLETVETISQKVSLAMDQNWHEATGATLVKRWKCIEAMSYMQARTPKILDECSGCTGVLLSLNKQRQIEEPQSWLLA